MAEQQTASQPHRSSGTVSLHLESLAYTGNQSPMTATVMRERKSAIKGCHRSHPFKRHRPTPQLDPIHSKCETRRLGDRITYGVTISIIRTNTAEYVLTRSDSQAFCLVLAPSLSGRRRMLERQWHLCVKLKEILRR